MMRVIISLALLHRLCSEKHNTQCNISNDSNVPNKVTYQIVFHVSEITKKKNG